MNDAVKLVPNKPDTETAEELKKKIVEAYNPILKILDEVTALGFQANVVVGQNAFKKMQIQQLIISKVF